MAERRFHNYSYSLSEFVSWLQSQGKSKWTIRANRIYSKRFAQVLDTGNAAELMTLSPRNRHHAMAALANLAKFTGPYDDWVHLRRRYNLKWSNPDSSMASFEQFFNPDMTLESMIQKVKRMIQVLPSQLAEVVRFCTITGLRATEADESVKLIAIRDTLKLYYNQEHQTLEHFLFPEIFLRQAKKGYISYITLENYQRIASLGAKAPSWNAIRLTCKRRGLDMEMQLAGKSLHCTCPHAGYSRKLSTFCRGRFRRQCLAGIIYGLKRT